MFTTNNRLIRAWNNFIDSLRLAQLERRATRRLELATKAMRKNQGHHAGMQFKRAKHQLELAARFRTKIAGRNK